MQVLENVKNLSVTVMGLGLNGGGLAAASFFAERGAKVTVTDLKSGAELAPSIQKLSRFPGIRFVLGEHRIEDFKTADIVIKNPGVKREGNIYLEKAKHIETDISVFLSLSKAPLLAVTGSKGKSSTVSALHYGLKTLGYNAFLGGNITVSPLTFLEQTNEHTPVVLELSSWQLADLRDTGTFIPRIAVITPIMPDHLNWYGSMEKYVADKKIIYKNMDAGSQLICSYDDNWGACFARETKAQTYRYSEKMLPAGIPGVFFDSDQNGFCILNEDTDIRQTDTVPVKRRKTIKSTKTFRLLSAKAKVPGIKLKQNVLNAALALILYGADPHKISHTMDAYGGIEHRLEFFYEADGIAFYNDSAATIPEAAAAAINAFEQPPVLICGGTNKNLDFTPLAETAVRAKSLYILGGSGSNMLIPLLNERGIPYYGPYSGFDTLLTELKPHLERGDTVVLSPGAASFELFTNEFYRGNQFKEKVRALF